MDTFRTAAALFAASLMLASSGALAQAVERNLPPAPLGTTAPIVAPNAVPSSQDDTPIGPALSGILVLGPQDAVRTAGVIGVSTGLVLRLDTPAARGALTPFLGRPLSRKLIAEVEAAIARYYRQAGFPFVSLSTPPQVIGGGMLQVRVVEFHDGTVSVTGVEGRKARRIQNSVRLEPGQPIDARKLSDDLDWLNRYPFRHVEAIFSPGDALGRTDLDLQVTDARPWQVYAGYANTGSPGTTFDRYLLGGQVGGLLVPDSLFSYQFTASPDFFDDHGKAFGDTNHPRYLSHGLRGAIPFAPRQEMEASFDHVETNEPSDPFTVRQITDELSLGYRSALSNVSSLPGDVTLGIEAKQERHKTFFAGVDVLNGTLQVYQFYAGWSYAWSEPSGKTAVVVTLHHSPGGISRDNTGAAFSTFTNGRLNGASYQYINAQVSRLTRLPGRWTVSNVLIAQYAGRGLPDTEQMGVGGADLVRGYTLDDGAYDNALVSRNELRSPAFPVVGGVARIADRLSPFVFLDAGYGASRVIHRDVHPASTGAGADYQLSPVLSLSLTAAYALTNGIQTKTGNWLLHVRTSASF